MNTSGETAAAPFLADIPLLLTSPMRHVSRSPSGLSAGLISLHAWQVDRVPRLPPGLGEFDAHLIKITYDLDVEPAMPSPAWFEIGFTFAVAGTMVHDALPQHVVRPDEARSYALNGALVFARQDDQIADPVLSDIALPAVAPEVLVFGRGSPGVRWRHTGSAEAPVRPGSRTGWIVLLVPAGLRQALVRATARFALPPGQAGGLREQDQPDAFTVDLSGSHRAVTAEGQRAVTPRATGDGPRVFVTYAHDSAGHKKDVEVLCSLLADAGTRVILDQHESPYIRRDWHEWMTTGISRADFIVVVASGVYQAVGLSELSDQEHSGAQAEYRLLMTLLRGDRSTWLPRILPVVLPGHAVAEIPVGLQPYDADYYIVPRLDAGGVTELLQVIGHQRPR